MRSWTATTALPLATAQDHKRAFDGDQGPNTGGMGAYSPAPIMTPEMCAPRHGRNHASPPCGPCAEAGTPFKGVLYAGLMVKDGAPKLIEYNVRFGDPECQVLMLRLKSDLLPALMATADGNLRDMALDWSDDVALCVVMAAKGYPGPYAKGSEIKGLDAAGADPQVQIFHAGTRAEGARILADGGRVLGVTARGNSIDEARGMPMRRWTRSTGRRASAAATSAGGRSRGKRLFRARPPGLRAADRTYLKMPCCC